MKNGFLHAGCAAAARTETSQGQAPKDEPLIPELLQTLCRRAPSLPSPEKGLRTPPRPKPPPRPGLALNLSLQRSSAKDTLGGGSPAGALHQDASPGYVLQHGGCTWGYFNT